MSVIDRAVGDGSEGWTRSPEWFLQRIGKGKIRSHHLVSFLMDLPLAPTRRTRARVRRVSAQAPSSGAGARSRSNEEWIRALSSDAPTTDSAYSDLRAVILRGLRRVLASRGVPDSLCEDVAQEALVRVRERLADFRGDSQFTTWTLSIATRLAFDELRHKRWKDVSFEAVTADAKTPLVFESATVTSQERMIARQRVLGRLRQVLENEITDRQRIALVAELKGMPHAEIATSLGVTRNAVYKLTHDARKRVQAQLQAAGISANDVLWAFE
jgi:RNA polymerase sigma-70 factor, ECF subfamily